MDWEKSKQAGKWHIKQYDTNFLNQNYMQNKTAYLQFQNLHVAKKYPISTQSATFWMHE